MVKNHKKRPKRQVKMRKNLDSKSKSTITGKSSRAVSYMLKDRNRKFKIYKSSNVLKPFLCKLRSVSEPEGL